MNKLILMFFLILIIFNKAYSQTLNEQERTKYAELILHIKNIYKIVSYTVKFLHKYENYRLSDILWSDLARYDDDQYLPYVNSKVYNDPKGLIITLWGIDNYKYFASTNNYYQGLFAIEVYIANSIIYKYKKYIYYVLDEEIDYSVNLSAGRLVTGKPGINPLLQTGQIQSLGEDSNYSSIYILCYY